MIPQVAKKAVSGAARQWSLLLNAPRQTQDGVGQVGTGLPEPSSLLLRLAKACLGGAAAQLAKACQVGTGLLQPIQLANYNMVPFLIHSGSAIKVAQFETHMQRCTFRGASHGEPMENCDMFF